MVKIIHTLKARTYPPTYTYLVVPTIPTYGGETQVNDGEEGKMGEEDVEVADSTLFGFDEQNDSDLVENKRKYSKATEYDNQNGYF